MPHGGFKHSGYGKDLSMYGFEDYTRIKHVMANIDSLTRTAVSDSRRPLRRAPAAREVSRARPHTLEVS